MALQAALPHTRRMRTERVVDAIRVEKVERLTARADDEEGYPEGEEQIPKDEYYQAPCVRLYTFFPKTQSIQSIILVSYLILVLVPSKSS